MAISYRQEVYRKLIHLSSLWMSLWMLLLPRCWAAVTFAVLLVLNIIVEYGYYRKWKFVYPFYDFIFGKMMRDKQPGVKFQLSGGPPVLASALLSVLLFPRPYAVAAFTIMLLSDTAAALIGRRWGKTKFANGKSLEGTLAFIVVGVMVIALIGIGFDFRGVEYFLGIIGVVLAAWAEFHNEKLRIDDNFSIPLIIGCALCLTLLV